MKNIYISKKNQTNTKLVARVDFSGNFIEVSYTEKGVLRVLEELYKQKAFTINKSGKTFTSEEILSKAAAFNHNILTKMPAPYFIDKDDKQIEDFSTVYWEKEKRTWNNRQ